MKKVIVLLSVLLGVSIWAHADTTDVVPQQANGTVKAADSNAEPAAGQKAPANNNADKVDSGSGDDVDTVNEADPANDIDPEADEDTATVGALPAK